MENNIIKDELLLVIKKEPKTFNELLKMNFFTERYSGKKLNAVLSELSSEDKIYFSRKFDKYFIKDDETIIGTFKSTRHDFGFVENDDISVFIPGRFIQNSFEGDTVKVLLFKLKDGDDVDRRAGKIIRIMKRNGNSIIVRAKKVNDKIELIPDDFVVKNEIRYLGLEDFNDITVGDIFIVKFFDLVSSILTFKIKKKLGNEDDASLDFILLAIKNNVEVDMDEDVVKAAQEKVDDKKETLNRVDISNELIVTIDGDDSKDLDDAVSVRIDKKGNFILGVHIADVSYYVDESGTIDEYAQEKSTSVYLIDKVISMLPKELSDNLCSLNPNEEKLTLTCEMTINEKGQVINQKVFESIIISKYRLTYSEVDNFLSKDDNNELRNDPKLSQLIYDSQKLSKILRVKKINDGMIDFSLSELKIELDENSNPISLYSKKQTESEKIIEDLMVVTNETIAKIFVDRKIPTIFRIHEKPKIENLEKFFRIAASLGIVADKNLKNITSGDLMKFITKHDESQYAPIFKRYLIQSMEKAIYNNENFGHYALGLNHYLHFTSPIRRYPDLIVHRMIRKYIINAESNRNINLESLKEDLKLISKNSSKKEREAMSMEKKLLDIKKTRLMEKEIGKEFNGMIVSFSKTGIFVELENLVQGMILIESIEEGNYYFNEEKMMVSLKESEKNNFRLGQKIKIKIGKVNISQGLIDLILIDK